MMTVTNQQSGTSIDEVGDGIFRIHTPVREIPGGFSFNQYLVVDDEPLLFHTGGKKLFPLVHRAIDHVMPIAKLRWISFSHFEPDECGALNDLLAVAPNAQPACSKIGAIVCINDYADRAPRALEDGATFSTGKRTFQWIDAPHLPHGWDCGFLFEQSTHTLLCGDLFTQPGAESAPITESDILGPSEAFRGAMDYFSHGKKLRPLLDKLVAKNPRTLACMHGSAWRGDGAKLLRALGDALGV
jgi:flavorubredoxin